MAELQHHCPLTMEVHNEGSGKEGVGRNVGMPDIVVGMDEGILYVLGDKEASLQSFGPKNKGNQIVDTLIKG